MARAAKTKATSGMAPAGGLIAPKPMRALDAGKSGRRLKGVPTTSQAINAQLRRYGKAVLARSRYLANNNPYAASAKQAYLSALVGTGIKPSWLTKDAALKAELQQSWLDWTDETDADGLTDFYGQQAIIAGEMFEAGECFVRLRPRRDSDGLTVPLQLQILPAEMLPLSDNRMLSGGHSVECGIEFNAVGQRVAYHFLRYHPGNDAGRQAGRSETVRVPASDVLHLFKPLAAGQIRGIPHTISGITRLALLDQYDDAELARKIVASSFAAFVKRQAPEDAEGGPLAGQKADAVEDGVESGIALEAGSISELGEGEDIVFSEPADVGGSYEPFQYRQLLSVAAGFGVTYQAMTGDLRQTSYGSMRGGELKFRRRIEAEQHHVMVFQFCRPVANRFLRLLASNDGLDMSPSAFLGRERELRRIKWIPPHWPWIDPEKDIKAEKLAVDNGFKSRSDVIDAQGYDPEETDRRIAADREREASIPVKSIFGGTGAAAASSAPSEPEVGSEDEPADEADKERDNGA